MVKKIAVDEIVTIVNQMLRDSADDASERRQGAMNVLEAVLHSTGNYRGFAYLPTGFKTSDGKPSTCRPGVNYVDGLPHPDIDKRFENTDRTRVEYI